AIEDDVAAAELGQRFLVRGKIAQSAAGGGLLAGKDEREQANGELGRVTEGEADLIAAGCRHRPFLFPDTSALSSPRPSGERARVRGQCPSAKAATLNPSPGAVAPTTPLRGEVRRGASPTH